MHVKDSLRVISEERVLTKDSFRSTREYQMHNFISTILNVRQNYIVHETAIRRNPHNSSTLDSRATRHLSYKHAFCQNVVCTTKLPVLIFS